MKYILGIVAIGFMIWGLIEQTYDKQNIWVQIIAVIVFFYVMMRLMDKTPSKFDKEEDISYTIDENQSEKQDKRDV